MGEYTVLTALCLAGFIVLHEVARWRKLVQIDSLLVASVVYFICYSIIPIFLRTLQDRDLGLWSWIYRLPFDNIDFLVASSLAILGYIAILLGYYAFLSTGLREKVRSGLADMPISISESVQIGLAFGFGLIGILSLLIYVNEVGGFAIMVQAVGFFRSQTEPFSEFGFVIKVAPLTTVSSYLLFGLFTSTKNKAKRVIYLVSFVLMFLSSLLILYVLGGRVQFAFYLLVFMLYSSFLKGRISLGFSLLAAVAIAGVFLFGKDIITGYAKEDALVSKWDEILSDPFVAVRYLLIEFSFPFVTLANLLDAVPGDIRYQWFVDVPLGVAYLLPKPLLGLDLPPTVTMIYDEYIDHPIPIDLLSFGYVNMDVFGILLVCLAFGFLLSFADCCIPSRENRTAILLRAAWILYLSSQVMYGSPHHALVTGFPLIVGTVALALFAKRRAAGARTVQGARWADA